MPVGFGGLEIFGDQALLRSVVTLPPVRNRGIGTAIVSTLEAEARIRGCLAVWLATDQAAAFFRGRATALRAFGSAGIDPRGGNLRASGSGGGDGEAAGLGSRAGRLRLEHDVDV